MDVACGTELVATDQEQEGIDLTPELISRANENSKLMGWQMVL